MVRRPGAAFGGPTSRVFCRNSSDFAHGLRHRRDGLGRGSVKPGVYRRGAPPVAVVGREAGALCSTRSSRVLDNRKNACCAHGQRDTKAPGRRLAQDANVRVALERAGIHAVYMQKDARRAYRARMDTFCLGGQTALLLWQQLRCLERPRLDRLEPLAGRLDKLHMTLTRAQRLGTGGEPIASLRGRLDNALRDVPGLGSAVPDACVSGLPYLPDPLDLLVSSRSARHHATGKRFHLWSGSLPPGSLAAMGEGVLVSMPEFALLHRACEVDFVQLVLLAYELCGAYALDRSGLAGALRCQQLTSSTRLARFLENVGSVRGGESLGRLCVMLSTGRRRQARRPRWCWPACRARWAATGCPCPS